MPPSTRAHDRDDDELVFPNPDLHSDWELESAEDSESGSGSESESESGSESVSESESDSEPDDGFESDSDDPDFDPDDMEEEAGCRRSRSRRSRAPFVDRTLPKTPRRRGSISSMSPDYDENERAFLERLAPSEREELCARERALWADPAASDALVPLRFRILNSKMPPILQRSGLLKLRQLADLEPGAGDYAKQHQWLEAFSRLPIGEFRELPIRSTDPVEKTHAFLSDMLTRLDEVVYGHHETKVQVVQTLARWIANPHSRGLALAIQGPPGVGKSTIVKEGICKVLGLPFAAIPLGGANDVSYLDGHGFTYEGSMWGRLADALMRCGAMNPVLFFDELDKVSDTSRGQEIVNLLIHLTDPAQNDAFHDKYFHGVELDLSKALLVFSYNHDEQVNPILKDRLVTIRLQGYTPEQKIEIAQKHLLPSVLRDYGLDAGDVQIDSEVLREVLQRTPVEEGVRALRRNLDAIVGNLNVLRWVPVEDQARFVSSPTFRSLAVQLPFRVEAHHLAYFLRPRPDTPISHAMMYT